MIKGVLYVCPMLGPSRGYSEEPYRGTSSTQRDSTQAQRVHTGGAGHFPHALDPVSYFFFFLSLSLSFFLVFLLAPLFLLYNISLVLLKSMHQSFVRFRA